MSILFDSYPEHKFFISKWVGNIKDEEVIPAYKSFWNSQSFLPGYDEVVDLSEWDSTNFDSITLRYLANQAESMLSKDNSSMKTAVVAPDKLSYGLSRVYDAFSHESPESIGLFSDVATALHWLNIDLEL